MTHPPHTAVTVEDLLAHRAWLRALAGCLVRGDDAADDIVQDTWLAALRRPPREAGAAKSWLRRVAKNASRDRHRVDFRRAAREARAARPEGTASTADVVARAEIQRRLTNLVFGLDEPYRTAVLLRFFDGLPPREVAARTEVPVETARTRIRRGVERLRDALDAQEKGHREAWLGALAPLAAVPVGEAAASGTQSVLTTAIRPWMAPAAVAGLGLGLGLLVLTGGDPPAGAPTAAPEIADESADDEPQPPAGHNAPETTPATAPETASEDTRDAASRASADPWTPSTVPEVDATPSDVAPPPGTVHLHADRGFPMGMDEAELKAALTGPLGYDLEKWERFDFVWEKGLLFATPRHERPLADVHVSRFEVTNAQWKVFLEAPVNQDVGTTSSGMTLVSLARMIYGIEEESGPNVQRAWLYLWERNRETLGPVLNQEGKDDFDPLVERAGEAPLPAGLEIGFSILQPPPYWRGGTPPDDEMDRPVRFVSWADAREFCRWAGLHLPLEVEWERAARGPEGERLFPWGDEWSDDRAVWRESTQPSSGRPEPVGSMPGGATPEGLHHMAGNVSEWVFDLARPYPGSRVEFPYSGTGMLARGGNHADARYAMLAADRIWDVGDHQLAAQTRVDGVGFRYAAYPHAARELALELATYAQETTRRTAPYVWYPHPPGLSKRDREKRERRLALQGFALDRAAGWLARRTHAEAKDHAYVVGPADGIGLLPLKGISSSELRGSNHLEKLASDDDLTLFIGSLVSTANCHITLEDEAGTKRTQVWLGGDRRFQARHDLGFEYQVGAWLVLRGDRVAVYPGNGSEAGVLGAHLRREPLGYLPGRWTDTAGWDDLATVEPAATLDEGVAALTVPIPQLDPKTGEVRGDAKAAVLTVRVPVEFARE